MSTPFTPFIDGQIPKAADFNSFGQSAKSNADQTTADRTQTGLDRTATTASATAAALAASNAASSAGAALWASGTTYAQGFVVYSPSTRSIFRKLTASSVSTVDPATDTTNWGATIQPIASGGTGSSTVAGAKAALGFASNAELAASTGSALVGWFQSGIGAILRWVQDKLRETVSPYDFGAIGNGVADDTVAMQKTFEASRVLNVLVELGNGQFLVGNLSYGTNSTTSAQSVHGPGIRGNGQSSRFTAKPGTTGFVINAKATAGLILEGFVVDSSGICGGIDTSWNYTGVSQQNSYLNVWCQNYLNLGWKAQNNNDTTFLHCNVRGANGSDPVGFDIQSSGGLVEMRDCYWYGAKLLIDCQNAVFSGCGGMGIQAVGASYNQLSLEACYIYTNPISLRSIWTAAAPTTARIVSLVTTACHWPISYENAFLFDGNFKAGVSSKGDFVINAGGFTVSGLLAPTMTNTTGSFLAKVEFDLVTIDPGITLLTPTTGIYVNFLTCNRGGVKIEDTFRIGADLNTVITATKQIIGSVPGFAGVTTRGYVGSFANGTWYNVGENPIYFGVGRLMIFGVGNDQPVMNMSFGRPNTNPTATQTVITQQDATTSGESIAIGWGGGASLQWRITGGSKSYILRVFEDYIN